MVKVGVFGLRGGVGTTSMIAMVADALQEAGQSVLLIDLNPADMLKLHFNVPHNDDTGWAAASQQGLRWHEEVFSVTPNLSLLPFGRLSPSATDEKHRLPDLTWTEQLSRLDPPPRWVLFDMPRELRHHPSLTQALDLRLMVASVDAGCHVLLSQTVMDKGTRLLANMQDPSRALCNDLLLDWTRKYHDIILPIVISRDESVHESLAMKSPVTKAFPTSSAAQEAHTLATWLTLHQGFKA